MDNKEFFLTILQIAVLPSLILFVYAATTVGPKPLFLHAIIITVLFFIYTDMLKHFEIIEDRLEKIEQKKGDD